MSKKYRKELKGPAAAAAVAFVVLLFAGNVLAPRTLAKTGLHTGHTWRLWNRGHSERYIDSPGGSVLRGSSRSYNLGKFHAKDGDWVEVEYDATVNGGSFAIYLWKYRWGVWLDGGDYHHTVSRSERRRIAIPVGEDGIYSIRVSMFSFGGEFEIDWAVD